MATVATGILQQLDDGIMLNIIEFLAPADIRNLRHVSKKLAAAVALFPIKLRPPRKLAGKDLYRLGQPFQTCSGAQPVQQL